PHARFAGALPDDRALFGLPDEAVSNVAANWRDAAEPRFPLAAPQAAGDLYLPLSMPLIPQPDAAAGAQPQVAGPQVRGGLDAFSPALFSDPALTGLSSDALPAAAFHRRYVMGEELKGIHALFPVEEATLIAVPDAPHPTWAEDTVADFDLLGASELSGGLQWTAVTGADSYRLQRSPDPLFRTMIHAQTLNTTTAELPEPEECPGVHYFRVRAERQGGEPGPWSNTLRIVIPEEEFRQCRPTHVGAPVLEGPAPLTDNRVRLHWSGPVGAAYVLEEAFDPGFDGAKVVYEGPGTAYIAPGPVKRPVYYRVRAAVGEDCGPWSNTRIRLDYALAKIWRMHTDIPKAALLALQADLLRFAKARGDLLAVLAFPAAWREAELVRHSDELTAALTGDEHALSYGALYHPWTWVQEGPASLRLTPPDGAVTGRIAGRALARGAWIAPAGEPLLGVLALEPALAAAARDELGDSPVNLIRPESRGFCPLSEDTLSPDAELEPIHVRRLLILLRRVALREGAALAFGPNNDSFRRMVQRTFEAILAHLFQQGAFAGETPAESYQVVIGPSVNPRESIDLGRLVVELRVAPPQALTFLTVRLIQNQGAAPTVEEV
ncbi:MAG TPA: hypothetical protein VD902_07730, partial [Symbiobacteriaceae bacterium]|nr:hypothetical protein [Symbiobacteriaceae bacterium]